MAFKIANRARQLLILELNSGKSVYLAPGQESGAIEDYETNGNRQFEKLLSNGFIETATIGETAKEAQATPQNSAQASRKREKP
jgi:hypothetical protein